jgi:hypothetical protein
MNSEPVNNSAAKASLKVVREYFGRSEPFLSKAGMFLTTTSKVDDYEDSLDILVHNVQVAKIDKDRTNEAKWRSIDALTLAWEGQAVALIESVEAQVAEWDRKLHAAATPPAPIADRATLEAVLANARSDARMVLDAATERDRDVPYLLAEMARGEDPVLAYLVLGTSWPATYFRAHDLKSAPAVWEQERGKLLASVLTDAALMAYERLPGLPHARKAATALRMAHSLIPGANADHFARPVVGA